MTACRMLEEFKVATTANRITVNPKWRQKDLLRSVLILNWFRVMRRKTHRIVGSRRLYTRCQNFYLLARPCCWVSTRHTRPVPMAHKAVVAGVIETLTEDAIARRLSDFVADWFPMGTLCIVIRVLNGYHESMFAKDGQLSGLNHHHLQSG